MHRSALKTHKAKSKSRKKAKQQNETKRTKCKIRALKWEINIKTKGENDVEWRKNGKVSHLAIDMRSQRRRCWSRQAGVGDLGKAGLSRGVGGGRLRRLLPPTQLCRDLRSLWQVLSVVGLHILPPNEFSAKYLCACCCCCCGSNKSSSSSNSQWSGI